MARVQKWEPGDVALVTYYDPPKLALVRPRREAAPGYLELAYAEGGYDGVHSMERSLRRLVVIDPENREQVERLISAIGGDFYYGDTVVMQMALREFANPTPRIEEPRALGAVVEDGAGKRWTLSDPGSSTPWRVSDGSAFNCSWASIAPVRVLSEGVPAEASE